MMWHTPSEHRRWVANSQATSLIVPINSTLLIVIAHPGPTLVISVPRWHIGRGAVS